MTETDALAQDDPRSSFAAVTEALGRLMEATEAMDPTTLGQSTPCPEFTVADLMDHVVMVMRRVAVLGNGGHFSEVQHETLGSDWLKAYRSAAHDVMAAWTDPVKLGRVYEVPWGELPGAPLISTYTAELAVHGWDLATATGQTLEVDDATLAGALVAAKFLPAEGRGPEMPFDPVVDPGPDAPVLDQIAGWMGRQVITG